MQNRPLEQWQIDHILRMQQELGSPDTEEDEMNGDSENLQGALPQAADAVDAAGALSVYKDPNVLKAQTEYDTLAKKQTDRYDALERAIAEKRYAPSFSERMFQLSAALAAPTSRRGFGGILDNITPVLAAQEKAKREGEISRREALEKLDADRLEQQVGLAKQGLTTATAMARINSQRQPAEFGYQLDAFGNIKEIPKKVHRPKNEAEYATIPIGQYYVVPSGPNAGKVLVKR